MARSLREGRAGMQPCSRVPRPQGGKFKKRGGGGATTNRAPIRLPATGTAVRASTIRFLRARAWQGRHFMSAPRQGMSDEPS